jgi:NADH pyrophosphatase NudC (nudix superfamily)
MAKDDYLTTAQAAAAIDVATGTLQRWTARKQVTPTWTTPAGHARWDLADLKRQLGWKEQPETFGPQPVVAVIVTSEAGVLVGKRRDGRPLYTFIAGEIEPEESPADAAVREVKEETGLEIRTGQILGTRVHPATGRVMIYMTGEPVHSLDVFVGDERELAEVGWISLEETDRLMPDMFRPVRDYLARVLPTAA